MSVDIATLDIRVKTDSLKQGADELGRLEGQGRKAETATGRLSRGMGGLGTAVKGLAGAFAGLKLTQYAREAALAYANFETGGVVMSVVGRNAGYTSRQMEAMAQSLQSAGISMTESRSVLTRMTQAQLDLSRATDLARVAQDAAVIGNINSSEAFERMVYGIQSGQVEILRTIGLNVNFEASYKKAAAAMGKTTAELTEAEKAQIRANATMEAGAKIQGTYEASMETAGKQLGSLKRYHEDLAVVVGKTFSPATTAAVSEYTRFIKDLTRSVKELTGQLSTAEQIKAVEDSLFRAQRHLIQLRSESSDPLGLNWDTRRAERDIARLEAQLAKLKETRSAENTTDSWMARDAGAIGAAARGMEMLAAQTKKAADERERLADASKLTIFDMPPSYFNAAAGMYDDRRTPSEADRGAGGAEALAWIAEQEARQVEQNLELERDFYAELGTLSGNNEVVQRAALEREYEVYSKVIKDKEKLAQWLYEREMRLNKDWRSGATLALREYGESATNWARQTEMVFTNAFRGMEDALVEFTMTGKLSFTDFANSVIRDINRILIQQSITGPIAQGIGSLFAPTPNADGNVYGPSGLVPFAKGGVVTRPTIFPFANGIGLMGEAGPEAIMPLRRGPSGRLGVEASGGGGPRSVRVEVHNESGQQLQVSRSEASFDAQEMVISLWLDAFQRNKGGLRSALTG